MKLNIYIDGLIISRDIKPDNGKIKRKQRDAKRERIQNKRERLEESFINLNRLNEHLAQIEAKENKTENRRLARLEKYKAKRAKK